MSIQNIIVQHYMYGVTRNIFAGAGLCYAVEKKNYLEIPLTICFPSIYAGYHIYKNRGKLEEWINNNML